MKEEHQELTSDLKPTCFVIIGYGKKSIWSESGIKRDLQLDKTYHNLIEPVLKNLGFDYFRASDKNYENSGYIDADMYKYIVTADLVIADISTLNANALYELGIRHALRPQTTIIISEEGTEFPFDINHLSIISYKHLGEDIGVSESDRFKGELRNKISSVIDNDKIDSPVYTFIPDLVPPKFKANNLVKKVPDASRNAKSLSELVKLAEDAKNNKDFISSKWYLNRAIQLDGSNLFLKQRLALVTYKSKEPTQKNSLYQSISILNSINNIKSSNKETLGLSGAVHKRLFELEGDIDHLNEALSYYSRSFYLNKDYYAGINAAYLFTLRAAEVQKDPDEALTDYKTANRIRKEVIVICTDMLNLPDFETTYGEEGQWIYLTLAEAFFALGDYVNEEKYLEKARLKYTDFSKSSHEEQKSKLTNYINTYNSKYNN